MKVDTYQRRNTICRKCKRHYVIDEVNRTDCPYCTINDVIGILRIVTGDSEESDYLTHKDIEILAKGLLKRLEG